MHRRKWWLSFSAWNGPEVLAYESARFHGLEVPGDREYGVVRCVVCREKLSYVIERSLGQIFHRPDKRMMKWMRYRKDELLQLLQHCSVRLIINRPAALVFNDVALSIQLLLRHCGQQITHSIRFQPERQRQLV